MANAFKLKTFSGATTPANQAMQVYITPSATSSVIVGLTISNTSASIVFIDIKIDNADGDQVFLVKGAPVATGGSIEIMSGNKITLETGDAILVYSDLPNSVDTIVSVMEQS